MWERLVDRILRTVVRAGTMTATFPGGRKAMYGDGSGTPVALTFHDECKFHRIALNPELALPEAYVDGTMSIAGDDLYGFLSIAIRNLSTGRATAWQRLLAHARVALRIARQYNPVGKAQKNVAHHYDLSAALYDLFLDADKQYSCAYFRSPDDSLEQAQAQKKAHIAAKLRLEPDQRVLDIGCGWGGMALTLARDYGVRVLGVTLSREQYKIANQRAAEAGLSDRVEFRLADYRTIDDRFDRIVSVGMFEHVGAPHYREYFGHVRAKLADNGIALIHTIGRVSPPGYTSPWIRKYIFPGGYIPAMSEVMAAVEKEELWTTDIEVWRLHYAETLKHWQRRFAARRDQVIGIYDEQFFRMWRFYLIAAEMTFRHNRQCVFQFQLTREQAAAPLTRDYLYATGPDRKLRHAAE